MYFQNMNRQLHIEKIKYLKKLLKDVEGGYISRKVMKSRKE